AEATRYYEQGLVLHGEMGDQTQIATLLNNLGEAALASGSWDEARAWFQQSAAAAERAASRYVAAYAVSGLGQVALAVGEPTEARQHHLTSLAIREAIGDRAGVAASLRSIGALMTAEGGLEEASTLLGAAAARRDALNLKLRPAEEREQKALCASLAATLGDAGFGECWSHGRELDFADAVSLARGWLRAPDAEYVLQP
ncbi:MAG: tetratricopeptide repeat protein, partial [Armatimonadetes bacterium]|nr:tetratricopeptide repeat protein [Armatimonadota bacterium]